MCHRFGLREIAERRVREEVPLRLSRLKKAVAVELRGEAVARSYGDYLETTARDLKSKVWRAVRGKQSVSAAEVEISLGAKSSNLLKETRSRRFCGLCVLQRAARYSNERCSTRGRMGFGGCRDREGRPPDLTRDAGAGEHARRCSLVQGVRARVPARSRFG